MLSFLFALLLLHPEAYRKLQQEVDTVLKGEPATADHINQLPYVKACLRESLRLHPPSAGFSVAVPGGDSPEEPVLLGGKWLVRRNQPVFVLTPGLHRDATAFGDDVEEFKPERMMEENFQKLPPGCYKVRLRRWRPTTIHSTIWLTAFLHVALWERYTGLYRYE